MVLKKTKTLNLLLDTMFRQPSSVRYRIDPVLIYTNVILAQQTVILKILSDFLLSQKNSSAKDTAMEALVKVEAELGNAFASLGILRE